MPYTDIDSVLISPLNVGTYSVIARLYEGGLADAHTITFRVEEYLSVVKEKSLEPEVVLFPNPTNEEITVDFGNFFTNPKIEIYNLEGRLIEVIDTNTNNSMVTIDVSTFSHGVYLLRVNDKERSITKKFIKKRSN